jgi:O-antigen/teichoic acid export membrane protein
VTESSFRIPKLRDAALIAYKALADLAGKGSLFLVTVAAARRLSPEAFGVFSLGSALGWMVAVATDFGIQLHVARAVSRTPDAAPDLLRAWLRVRVWTASAAIVIVTAALVAGPWPASYTLPIAIFTAMYACSGLVEFLHYFYRGLSRSDIESSLILWQRGGTLVVGLAALAWRPNVTLLAIALLIPVVVTLAVSVGIARTVAPGSRDAAPGVRSTGLQACDVRTDFRRHVWPIGAGIVLSALYFRIDVFLVELWSGTQAVAVYNAVFRLVEALRLFPAAVLAVTLPSLCRARDLRTVTRTSLPLVGLSLAVTVAGWVTADWIIPFVYGAQYAGGVTAFRILLLAFPLMSLNYALTHQLIGWDGQRAYAAICAAALLTNVALNARLIPLLSIDGAAWATVATEALLTAACAAVLVVRAVPIPLQEHEVLGEVAR